MCIHVHHANKYQNGQGGCAVLIHPTVTAGHNKKNIGVHLRFLLIHCLLNHHIRLAAGAHHIT